LLNIHIIMILSVDVKRIGSGIAAGQFAHAPDERSAQGLPRRDLLPAVLCRRADKVTGNPMRLAELMDLMDEFPRMFEIVEPKRVAVS
jgi:hypothetical protein